MPFPSINQSLPIIKPFPSSTINPPSNIIIKPPPRSTYSNYLVTRKIYTVSVTKFKSRIQMEKDIDGKEELSWKLFSSSDKIMGP